MRVLPQGEPINAEKYFDQLDQYEGERETAKTGKLSRFPSWQPHVSMIVWQKLF